MGSEGSAFNGHRVSVWEGDAFPERDGGWQLHDTVNVLDATEQ